MKERRRCAARRGAMKAIKLIKLFELSRRLLDFKVNLITRLTVEKKGGVFSRAVKVAKTKFGVYIFRLVFAKYYYVTSRTTISVTGTTELCLAIRRKKVCPTWCVARYV